LNLVLCWSGPGGEERCPVGAAPILIGRAPECQISLCDPRVSRRHARVEVRDGLAWIRDEGSQNGLRVNGRRVQETPLREGDRLVVGGTRIRVAGAGSEAATMAGIPSPGAAPGGPPDFAAMAADLQSLGRISLEESFFFEAIDRARSWVGGDRAYLLECQKSGMRILAGWPRGSGHHEDLDISWTIATQAATRQESILSLHAGEDPRFLGRGSIEELRVRAVLAVPVTNLGRPVGVLYLERREVPGAFTDEDLRRIELYAAALGACWRVRLLSGARPEGAARAHGRPASQAVETPVVEMVGGSARMDDLRHLIQRVAATELPVLIQGESGAGKELVARAIHAASRRSRRPFHVLNCAAIPESLLEAELFGHVRGAFTGAEEARRGVLEQADGGTLFLDEVAEMSPNMQSGLLRVLEEGELRPLGSTELRRIDVRLLAATNRDLLAEIRGGRFREDLYFRLRVLPVRVPPLRERREDIPHLIQHFLAHHAHPVPPALTREALDLLTAYRWPGNVRELENEIKRLCVLGGATVGPDDLSPSIRDAEVMMVGKDSDFQDLDTLVESIEVREIRKALERSSGNKTKAAELLGITRFSLQRKMDRFGISIDQL
jgi:transcriptional regulator with GAF, ATPase, and Fis domain